ncbi:MAG: ABC transporter ATP-binding protein [Myxococcaceae bacterium]|nr:ABC transporter ATP-binding protein [Myxococcaceae bacterium]MBH2006772.1 ABC transporter ATP-binding protein [Myxococcaceae bacterium]
MNLELEQLSKSYFLRERKIVVLKDFSASVASGERVSIVGASGAGKSTLLHLIGTLDAPCSGEIRYDGQSLSQSTDAEWARFRNQKIGFVFQFHHLLPEFTALENVGMPLLFQRAPDRVSRSKQWLERVGLGNRWDHKPGELSGGEQQRVALARALVAEPQLLLLDEPTGNLDETTGAGIVRLIEELNQELGLTVLMVTHNPRLVWDKVWKLNDLT